ncbi:MAG: SufBD protein [Clostridiales bacterium]|nr:SufBD protein [Clostridiales bacterium]
MENASELINGLFDKNDKAAYKCLKELLSASEKDSDIYRFFDTFTEMIDNDNSYVRTRGLLLISANAKWDTDFKIDEIIDKYLSHVMDDKPITSRQCIKALPNIAKYKPDLIDDILSALKKSNPQQYADSMRSLVYNDIKAALKIISEIGGIGTSA